MKKKSSFFLFFSCESFLFLVSFTLCLFSFFLFLFFFTLFSFCFFFSFSFSFSLLYLFSFLCLFFHYLFFRRVTERILHIIIGSFHIKNFTSCFQLWNGLFDPALWEMKDLWNVCYLLLSLFLSFSFSVLNNYGMDSSILLCGKWRIRGTCVFFSFLSFPFLSFSFPFPFLFFPFPSLFLSFALWEILLSFFFIHFLSFSGCLCSNEAFFSFFLFFSAFVFSFLLTAEKKSKEFQTEKIFVRFFSLSLVSFCSICLFFYPKSENWKNKNLLGHLLHHSSINSQTIQFFSIQKTPFNTCSLSSIRRNYFIWFTTN